MEPGTRIREGRYEIRGVLGEGAQGATYDAGDTVEERAVAIKRFDVRGAKSWKDVELAERETRVLSSLDHPLVAKYIEHFEDDGALYLVMEKVEGETLESIRQRQGTLSEDEVRRFLADADRALTYLHGRSSPVVHRDIKPRNIVRRPDGSWVLVDFGAVSEQLARRGKSSTVVGTMGYMAPEQFQGRALAATDIYGVGATALAALTGVEPETLPHQGLKVDVRAALEGKASEWMIGSLEQMLEPDPDRRPKSLAALLDRGRAVSQPPVRTAVAVPVRDQKSEDAIVKSIRGLLWLLWGLSWVIVPLILGPLDLKRLIPIVMFGSLACLFVVTWHKGAVIRAILRAVRGQLSDAAESAELEAAAPVQPRIKVTEKPARQVRVRTGPDDLADEDLVGETEVQHVKRVQRR